MFLLYTGKDTEVHNSTVWKKGIVLFIVVLLAVTGINVVSKNADSTLLYLDSNDDAGIRKTQERI